MKTTLLIIAFLIASAFCQTSQPASQPTTQPVQEQVSEELQERIIKEAKEDYKQKRGGLECAIQIRKDIIKTQTYNSKSAAITAKEGGYGSKTAKMHLRTILTDLKNNKAELAYYSNQYEKIKPQIAGEDYFRKLDKDNISKDSCGQLLTGEFRIMEIIDANNVVAKVAIESELPKGTSVPKYTYKLVQIKISVGKRKVNDIFKTDEVFQIQGISTDPEKPELYLVPVKIIKLNLARNKRPYCR